MPLTDHTLTDLSNAEGLIEMYGQVLRYCPEWGAWLVWNGHVWERDESGGKPTWLAGKMFRKWAEDGRNGGGRQLGDDQRKKLLAWCHEGESHARLRACVSLAGMNPKLWVTPRDLDTNPWQLNTPKGTVNLLSGLTGKANPADLLTMATSCAPAEAADAGSCPRWLSFLDSIFAGDQQLIAYLQRALGYAITAMTNEQVFFILYGTGANGKSTLLDAVSAILGDYASTGAPGVLESRDQDRHPAEIADLFSRRLVAMQETDRGLRLSEGLVKRLTGERTLKARYMRQDWFEFPVTFKLFYSVNHAPMLSGADEGIRRRIRQIPFTVTIPPEERDRDLLAALIAEGPGILRWLIEGCLAYQEKGLAPSDAAIVATEDYLDDQDTMGAFLAECCLLDGALQDTTDRLYKAWNIWREGRGEKEISHKLFGMRLAERGFHRWREGFARGYTGLGLNEEWARRIEWRPEERA